MKTQKTMFIALSLMLLMISGSFMAFAQEGSNATTETGSGTTSETGSNAITDTTTSTAVGGGTSSGGGGHRVPAKVALYISPEKQFAQEGELVGYEITIKDLHPYLVCKGIEGASCNRVPPSYDYKLSFESEEGTVGELSQEKITLKAGEKKTVKLSVKSRNMGANVFLITAITNGEVRAETKGVLVISGEGPIDPERPFFIGDGFALTQDEEDGLLVNIKLLSKDGVLKGKLNIGKRIFDAKGTVTNGKQVTLNLNLVGGKDIEGTFKGEVKGFDTFTLLEGKLEIEDLVTYDLTATSKREGIVRDIGEKEAISTRIREVVAIEEKAQTESGGTSSEINKEEFYIRPMKIKEEKFLWIFPTGKKILEVEVMKEGKVFKKEIREGSTKKIEGYNIEVGSLEDEENIELNVKESE